MDGNRAIVLRVDGKFFNGISPSGRLSLAWSLPGAKLFADWQPEVIEKAEARIAKKGRKSSRQFVEISTMPANARIEPGRAS